MSAKIQVSEPLVILHGDEMAQVAFERILDQFVRKRLDIDLVEIDLSAENRLISNGGAVIDAIVALKKYGVGIKNAGMTVNRQQLNELLAKHPAIKEAELDITAFMNLMIVLVPVLLLSMVFTQNAVLDLKYAGSDTVYELYINGLELANAFSELTDPKEQRCRFENDESARVAAGKSAYPLPEKFLVEMSSLPDSAGIALGLDRLIMLLTDSDRIDQTDKIMVYTEQTSQSLGR